MSSQPLEGQSVLVTGSASDAGVGVGVVEAVIRAGGRPILNGRDESRLAESVKRYASVGAVGVAGDVTIAQDCERMLDEAFDRVGVVDHLVNNAGIGLQKRAHLAEAAEFDRLFGVDVRGVWLMTRGWLRRRLDGDGRLVGDRPASVVNVSSVHAQRTIAGYALYAACKGAVEAMTRGLAVEYGPSGVRVNCIAPGLVWSAQNAELLANLSPDAAGWSQRVTQDYQALNRPIAAREVGDAVAFMLSPMAAAVTGQTLTVDAGGTLLLFARSFSR